MLAYSKFKYRGLCIHGGASWLRCKVAILPISVCLVVPIIWVCKEGWRLLFINTVIITVLEWTNVGIRLHERRIITWLIPICQLCSFLCLIPDIPIWIMPVHCRPCSLSFQWLDREPTSLKNFLSVGNKDLPTLAKHKFICHEWLMRSTCHRINSYKRQSMTIQSIAYRPWNYDSGKRM